VYEAPLSRLASCSDSNVSRSRALSERTNTFNRARGLVYASSTPSGILPNRTLEQRRNLESKV